MINNKNNNKHNNKDKDNKHDKHDLTRFIRAQNIIYKTVLNELLSGQKETHWIWYIFPQEKGLGTSSMSAYYGLDGVEEAKAYLNNKKLRKRLIECISIVDAWEVLGKTPQDILGELDAMKYESCKEIFKKAGLDL